MSTAAKQWTVKIVAPLAGPLAVLRDGGALPAEIDPGLTSPVEVLLVSIGTCFALSCYAAFAARGLERVGFEVTVTGRKAPLPPSRLENIGLEVTFDASLPLAKAQALTALAKQLCTVTNTVTSEPPCLISTYVAKPAQKP
jgi:uncharacterized OsmC-like protein